MSSATSDYLQLREMLDRINEVVREFEVKCSRGDPECHETNFMFKIEEVLKSCIWSRFNIEPSYEYKVRVREGFVVRHYGRIDAYYGLVFFEYKTPIPGLKSDDVRRNTIERIKEDYIPGLLKDNNVMGLVNRIRAKGLKPLIVGIIFDGRRLVFIEYDVDANTCRIEPEIGYYELTIDTLRRVIRTVLATCRRKLDATILASEFGYKSAVARKLVTALYRKLKNIEEVGGRPLDLFNEWRKTISIAYPIGGELSRIAGDYGITEENVDGVKLFFAVQTYYALILKVLGAEVASRFYDSALTSFIDQLRRKIRSNKELLQELRIFEFGGPPRWYGIKNLLEGQLFSWYLDVWDDELYEAVKALIRELSEFDVESLELDLRLARDVFKLLYEELVPRREVRQKLGIYTTPDWLAEFILDKLGLTIENMLRLAEEKGDPLAPLDIRILDPGVGTGTFLTLYIQRLGEYLRRKFNSRIPEDKARDALKRITRNVMGFDIDALALMTARVNYLIALASTGLLPYKGGTSIEIPIHIANSIVPVEFLVTLAERRGLELYKIETSVDTFMLPVNVVSRLDRLLDLIEEWLDKNSECSTKVITRELEQSMEEASIICRDFYDRLLNLKRQNRDTIWISIVKSYLLPLQLGGAFDYVVGNPPWLSYRYVADPNYQEKILKPLIKDEYKLTREPELITQIEMATLFFIRCVDKFLKDGGRIGFVMPRAVFSADQHDKFRRAKVEKVKFGIEIIIDAENVKPLFYVPTCSIIATKGIDHKSSIHAEVINGELPENRHKVMPLSEALRMLKVESKELYLNTIGERSFWSYKRFILRAEKSYYYDKFRNGATIYPRAYWLVDIVDNAHPHIVIVRSSRRVRRRESKVIQELGPRPVERDYLYGVLTASELVPFYHLLPNVAVLPIRPGVATYQILGREVLRRVGHKHIAEWLNEVEKLWEEHRGAKAERMSIYEWLDYQRKLTSQNPKTKYRVVYNTSGTHLVASVVEVKPLMLENVNLNDVIVDYTLYLTHTNIEDEAHYLAAVLNSTIINEFIKPMQPKGEFGERHICKKPLELPIPEYNSRNSIHRRLAELGRLCRDKVKVNLDRLLKEASYDRVLEEKGVLDPRQLGILRQRVRHLLIEELGEIDELTLKLLENMSSEPRGLLKYGNKT